MRVALVTGSLPPNVCGVGDYTARLAEGLERAGVRVTTITGRDWSLFSASEVAREIRKGEPDIIHLQYPTAGFGSALGPHRLSGLCKPITTIHEVSQLHPLRRISLYPFTLTSRHLVFTSQFELQYARRYAPWVKERASVIPIGANTVVAAQDRPRKTAKEIVYFGLIRPGKGLEDVIQFASELERRGDGWKLRIVGAVAVNQGAYAVRLREQSGGLPIAWDLDLPLEVAAQKLRTASFAYLPFPDGVSERRGSLLALVDADVAVITTRGSQTTQEMEQAFAIVETPEQAIAALVALGDPAARQALLAKQERWARQFQWGSIVQKHMELYERLLPAPQKAGR